MGIDLTRMIRLTAEYIPDVLMLDLEICDSSILQVSKRAWDNLNYCSKDIKLKDRITFFTSNIARCLQNTLGDTLDVFVYFGLLFIGFGLMKRVIRFRQENEANNLRVQELMRRNRRRANALIAAMCARCIGPVKVEAKVLSDIFENNELFTNLTVYLEKNLVSITLSYLHRSYIVGAINGERFESPLERNSFITQYLNNGLPLLQLNSNMIQSVDWKAIADKITCLNLCEISTIYSESNNRLMEILKDELFRCDFKLWSNYLSCDIFNFISKFSALKTLHLCEIFLENWSESEREFAIPELKTLRFMSNSLNDAHD